MWLAKLKQMYAVWSHAWVESAMYEAGYGCTLLANQIDAAEEQRLADST